MTDHHGRTPEMTARGGPGLESALLPASDVDPVHAVLWPFAWSLLAKATADTDPRYTKTQRSRLRESMTMDLRKCSDMLTPALCPPMVSRAAAQEAAALGVDLRTQTWQTQTRFDPGRRLFHFEHFAPLAGIRARVLQAPTVRDVLDILEPDLRVAWILKTEDRRLVELGYNSVRPDPAAAYAAAGIDLLPDPGQRD